jgi:hypothetical protein
VADKVSVKLRGTYSSKANRYACERRKSKRLLCSDLVQIYWQHPDGTPCRDIAILENVSAAGVGLFTGVPIPDHTEVCVTGSDMELTGRVTECVFRENGYIVAMELHQKSGREQRCPSDFVPEHLLDLSLLDFE